MVANHKQKGHIFSAYMLIMLLVNYDKFLPSNRILSCPLSFHSQNHYRVLLLKPSTSSSPWPWMTKFMKETVRFHFGTQMKPEKCAKDDTGHMVLKNDSNRIQTKHAR